MDLAQRRLVARIVRFGLVALAIVLVAGWIMGRARPERRVSVDVSRSASAVPALGPGDLRIVNEDSTVDLVLAGDQISAGLSPQLIAKVRDEMARAAARETTGFAGAIAQMVSETVAGGIGTRAVFPVREIADLRLKDGRVLVRWRAGGESELLGDVRTDGNRPAGRFRDADARRFIEAVRARQRELR